MEKTKAETREKATTKTRIIGWILRFIKGIFIGSGFILPGVSGGLFAAVFGIYERLIRFIANITQDFIKNVIYFLPVGLGGLFGTFLLSIAMSYLLGNFEVQILWFFIGYIVGTLPALWKQAGMKGRGGKHVVIMFISAALGFVILNLTTGMSGGMVPQTFATWIMAGGIIGLGVVIPGLSPSNFLVCMGMFKPMTDGIKSLDLAIIIPLGLGSILVVLALSKVMNYIFSKAYTGLFHIILGVVLTSIIMIVPTNFNYLSAETFLLVAILTIGIVLGYWMSSLEERYKPIEA